MKPNFVKMSAVGVCDTKIATKKSRNKRHFIKQTTINLQRLTNDILSLFKPLIGSTFPHSFPHPGETSCERAKKNHVLTGHLVGNIHSELINLTFSDFFEHEGFFGSKNKTLNRM